MPNQEVVKIEKLWVYYDGIPVLEDVSLSVAAGDFLGIMGPNGAGKTTLLKTILGLVRPTSGFVSVLGQTPEKARPRVGYVPQSNLFDHDFPLNVQDAVLMGRLGRKGLGHFYQRADREIADQALKTVGMWSYRNHQLGKLSGGEQQRVFIARALVSQPALLLLDEPTTSIDSTMQTEFYELLENLKRDMAIVMVSHDIGAISVYVNKIACLNRQLYYHGSKEISTAVLEATYKCPVQMIAHGSVPHRVLKEH